MDNLEIFALDGKYNLVEEDQFGIVNGALALNVRHSDVGSFRGLYAPPYGSTDFFLELRLFGEKVRADNYKWYPFEVDRFGSIHNIEVSTSLVLPPYKRAGVLAIKMTNSSSGSVTVPVQFTIRGGFGYESFWEFCWPTCNKPTEDTFVNNRLVKSNENGAVVVDTDMDECWWEHWCSHLEGRVKVKPGEAVTRHITFTIGPKDNAISDANDLISDPGFAAENAVKGWGSELDNFFSRVPKLESSDERLAKLYHRSLCHLLLNQWRVPDLILNPYYSTGSINGGCVCSYLWDYGECWEILPLYDSQGARTHIMQFLKSDITVHFAFTPVTGQPFGPWYPVNQEKILFSILYYVLITGDKSILDEEVLGKSVIDWVVWHATYRDDLTRPVALVDYGNGNNHLELRKQYRYDNYLPDLNLRRCSNYNAAAELCMIAGKDYTYLVERAEELRDLVKTKLWDPDIKWFHNLDVNFGKHTRYTVQMFKTIAAGGLDAEEESGLLSHLNEDEFLSEYGIHSMSKKDEAFDQIDIDNGGGGICSCFPGHILEKLFKGGYSEIAEDIIKRILWWGERLPYWSDSIVANNMDYRRDTPLQNAIGAASLAGCVIFGLLGVSADIDGRITVNPSKLEFSPQFRLSGLKLRGRCLDIEVDGNTFCVIADGNTISSVIGKAVVI